MVTPARNENSGLVLTIEGGGEAGSKIVQTEYDPGEPSQLFDINYYQKQAVIFSTLWPDCVITVDGGTFLHFVEYNIDYIL